MNREHFKDFLPEKPINGRLGFYPAMNAEEYRSLPLPMRCATWDANVEAVIFDTYFSDVGAPARVAVHPQYAFKCLFRHSDTDTLLYSVCAVKLKTGEEISAKWLQDTTTGAFEIVGYRGHTFGRMGGFGGHIPCGCKKNDNGEWGLDFTANEDSDTVVRSCLS